MRKLTTIEVLSIISIVDLIFGSHGGVTVVLWIGYGVYKNL